MEPITITVMAIAGLSGLASVIASRFTEMLAKKRKLETPARIVVTGLDGKEIRVLDGAISVAEIEKLLKSSGNLDGTESRKPDSHDLDEGFGV
jgi:hypothetical protein